MPIIKTEIDTSIPVSIEFEAFCGICGNGICSDATVDSNRRGIALTIGCSYCMDRINELEEQIRELEK